MFPHINNLLTKENEIQNIINSLNTNNSSGYNRLLTKLLKTWTDYINVPLRYLHSQLTSKETSHTDFNILTLNLYLSAEEIILTENLLCVVSFYGGKFFDIITLLDTTLGNVGNT
jgi:hypothetical protein